MRMGKRITKTGFLNKTEEKTVVGIIWGCKRERKRYVYCLRKDIHYYNFMFIIIIFMTQAIERKVQ